MIEVLVEFNTLIKFFCHPLLDKVKGQVDGINQQLKQVEDMLQQPSKEEANKLVDQIHELFEQLDLRLDQLVHLVTHGEFAGAVNAVVDKQQRQLEG